MDDDTVQNDQSATSATVGDSGNQAETLQSVIELIKSYTAQITKDKKELTEMRNMLKDALVTDKTYAEHNEAVKAAVKVRTATKQQLLKQPQLVQLAEKIKEAASQLKEAKDSLSDYLSEYQRLTGSTEIEDETGEINQIVFTARLVKANSKFIR